MKIEIRQNTDPAKGYEVYDLNRGKFIQGKSAMFPRDFDEDDIYNLLGEDNYRKFENGRYQFDITKRQIFEATNDINYYK